jgi:hypothetical protein
MSAMGQSGHSTVSIQCPLYPQNRTLLVARVARFEARARLIGGSSCIAVRFYDKVARYYARTPLVLSPCYPDYRKGRGATFHP